MNSRSSLHSLQVESPGEDFMIDIAKVTSKGQITLPADVRKELGVVEGDKILFIRREGRIYVDTASSPESAVTVESIAPAAEANRKTNKRTDEAVKAVRLKMYDEQIEGLMRAEQALQEALDSLASEDGKRAGELAAEIKRLRIDRGRAALARAQLAFEGVAEEMGLETDDDVMAMIKEIRQQRWDEQNADRH